MVEDMDGLYITTPPAILVRTGLVDEGIVWVIRKALYGLRKTPKLWGDKRDSTLMTAMVKVVAVLFTWYNPNMPNECGRSRVVVA